MTNGRTTGAICRLGFVICHAALRASLVIVLMRGFQCDLFYGAAHAGHEIALKQKKD
jgi:hypothetical protein